jgi:anti-anti-sigma factor
MDSGNGSTERLTVTIGLHEDLVVAQVAGELDYQYAGLLHRQVKDAWKVAQPAGLILDLKGVTFCDSMGIGVLVLLLQQSREQKSTLVLANLLPSFERTMVITGLVNAFQVAPSLEEAIEMVSATAGPEDASEGRPS